MALRSIVGWLHQLRDEAGVDVDPDAATDVQRMIDAWAVPDDRGGPNVDSVEDDQGVADAADAIAARLSTDLAQFAAVHRSFVRHFGGRDPARAGGSPAAEASARAGPPGFVLLLAAVAIAGLVALAASLIPPRDAGETENATSEESSTAHEDTAASVEDTAASVEDTATTGDPSGDGSTGNTPDGTTTIPPPVPEWTVEHRFKRNDSPPTPRELSAARLLRFPWWLFGTSLVAFVLLALGLQAARIRTLLDQARRLEIAKGLRERKAARNRDGPSFGEPYAFTAPPPMDPGAIDEAADVLARPRPDRPGHDLDIDATVDETIARGSCPTPRFVQAARQPELLVLVAVEDRSRPGEAFPLAHAVKWILDRWRRTGVRFERFDYDDQPERLRRPGSLHTVGLREVARRYGGARLLIWSRMRRPSDADGKLGWLSALRAWPRRAWIDLDPRVPRIVHEDEAGYALDHGRDAAELLRLRELERSGLSRYPLTPQGLVAAARRVTTPKTRARPVRDEGHRRAPGDLHDALEQWAAAACCVPDPTWAHLDALRALIPQVRRAIPEARGVWWLLRWLEDRGCLDPHTPAMAARFRLALAEDADAKLLRPGLRVQLDDGPQPLERWIRARLSSQLREAEPRTANERWRQRAKLAYHACTEDIEQSIQRLTALLGTPADGLARELLRRLGHRLDTHVVPEGQQERRAAARMAMDVPVGRRAALGDLLRVASRGVLGTALAGAVLSASMAIEFVFEGIMALDPSEHSVEPVGVAKVAGLVDSAVSVSTTTNWSTSGSTSSDSGTGETTSTTGGPIVVGSTGSTDTTGLPVLVDVESTGDATALGSSTTGGDYGEPASGSESGDDQGAPIVAPPMARGTGPSLVRIKRGTFMMGSPEGRAGFLANTPEHGVTLTHDFWMCQTEVTQAQWEAVMGDNPSNCTYGCGPKLPVHNVSWEMAVDFLNELSRRENLAPCYEKADGTWSWDRSCDGYRLPTEAEWEYATRAGTTSAYSFGDDASRLGKYAWFDDNSGNKAHEVAGKEPNRWGLHDVHGNVWEWVWDWYEEDYGEVVRTDPTGPKTGNSRVLRGGAFIKHAHWLRSANRIWVHPNDGSWSVGLRCARGPHPSAGVP